MESEIYREITEASNRTFSIMIDYHIHSTLYKSSNNVCSTLLTFHFSKDANDKIIVKCIGMTNYADEHLMNMLVGNGDFNNPQLFFADDTEEVWGQALLETVKE
jgi:hypothetical protein